MVAKAAVLFSFLVSCAVAQEFRGTISGSVTDAHGAGMPNVKIVAMEVQTASKSETLSDAAGQYTLPFLAPGVYQIAAEAAGFKRFVQDRLTVDMGAHPVLDVHMQVGDASQSISVTADSLLLDSANGTVGQVVTAQQMEDFPSNGRTPLMAAQLAIGVVATPTGSATTGLIRPFDNQGATYFSMGGGPASSNELLLDGAPDGTWNGWLAYSPPQDAVLQVSVQGFASDAAYGHTGGGYANHVTKSGTNDIHGSAFDYNKVSRLGATPFFTMQPGCRSRYRTTINSASRPAARSWCLRFSTAATRCSGCFPGRASESIVPVTAIVTVPTPAERTGDFSALLKAGANYQIYDPATGTTSGSQIARQPFPGNLIPANRLNPIALNLLKYYPAPNYAGRADGLNNFATNTTPNLSFNNEFGRLDFNVSDRQKLMFTMRHSYEDNEHSEDYLHNIATGYANQRPAWGSTLDDVYILNPMTVLDVRANWTRFTQYYALPSAGFDPTSLGFPSYIAAQSEFLMMPAIIFSGTTFQPLNTRSTSGQLNPSDSFQLFGDVVRVWGNRTLKFGADARQYRTSNYLPGNSTGRYTFGTNWTTGPFSNSAAAPLGQEMAAFLLGLPTTGSYDLNTAATEQSKYVSLFLQNDWRVKSNLTLNLGIRFEHESPATEKYGRAVNGFDTSAASPIAAAAMAAYAKKPIPQISVDQFRVPGGLTFAGPDSPNIYRTPSNILSPRFGFAWTPHSLGGKTVIRGGTGVFVYPIGINGGVALNQEGFSQTTQFTATNNNYLSPANTLSNPFPTGFQQPAGSSLGLATFLGQSVSFFAPSVRNPYSIHWNLGVQHQLPANILLEVDYIANHSVHLPVASTQLNAVPQAYLSKSPVRDQATINLLGSSVTNPFVGLLPGGGSLNGSTVGLQQLLLPFPEFPSGGVTMQNNGAGSSYYESLNLRVEKRLSGGLSLIANFVWNSYLERMVYLNAFDPAPEKNAATDSRPLHFVSAMTYRLPIGDGKLVNLGSGWRNRLFGSWVLNEIYTWQLGAPLNWGNVIYYGGDIHLNSSRVDGPAFDTSRFNTVSAQQLASNIRTFPLMFNNLRADGINKLDASVFKEFHFTERRYFQIRFEAFNVANHPKFAAPNLSPASSAFGQITSTTINPRQVQIAGRLVW